MLKLLSSSFQGDSTPSQSYAQTRRHLLTRAPGGAQSTLLAPGLAILAAAFCVGSTVPTQGLAAHVIGDFLPADVHVDVMVREVLWWHRPQKQVSPRSGLCHPVPMPHSVTCAAGTVDTALATKVQDEGVTAETMEGAFCVHALPVLTDHVLAFVVICDVRERCSGSE